MQKQIAVMKIEATFSTRPERRQARKKRGKKKNQKPPTT